MTVRGNNGTVIIIIIDKPVSQVYEQITARVKVVLVFEAVLLVLYNSQVYPATVYTILI